jgi:hypothetical protein
MAVLGVFDVGGQGQGACAGHAVAANTICAGAPPLSACGIDAFALPAHACCIFGAEIAHKSQTLVHGAGLGHALVVADAATARNSQAGAVVGALLIGGAVALGGARRPERDDRATLPFAAKHCASHEHHYSETAWHAYPHSAQLNRMLRSAPLMKRSEQSGPQPAPGLHRLEIRSC